MEAKKRGREGHPRRPAVHPDQRAGATRYVPMRAGTRHRVPRRGRQLHPRQRAGLPGVRARLHQRGDASSARTSDTEDLRRPVLRLRPGDRTLRPGQLAVRRATSGGQDEGEAHAERETRRRPGARVARPAGARRRARATRRCSTRAASTRSSSGTSPATPRRWSSGSAASRRRSSSRSARRGRRNSGRERTTALVYSVGWTQHSVGVQYIRTGAIIQLLLGNMGRPGGGVMALRGHASIQGSTDIPTLFNLLPGYLPMPHHAEHATLRRVGRQHPAPGAEGLLGQRRGVRGQPAQGVLGRRGHRRRTTSATATCPG